MNYQAPPGGQARNIEAAESGDEKAILDARILIVDDAPMMRELMRGCLQEAGFANVQVAEHGRAALDLVEVQTPDLIILDLAMPVLDGFQTCEELRRRPETRDVPVLVQSATDKLADVTRAFEVGANDIIGKPFKPIEVTTRMRVHLHNRLIFKSLMAYRKRVAQELDAAREMQEFLCPDAGMVRRAAERHGVGIGAVYRPSSEIGGDVWGLIDRDDMLAVYLADFAGHGVPAAMNTFRLHTLIARMAEDRLRPDQALAHINNELCETLAPGQYATLLWASLDRATGVLSYATAGAPPPLVWSAVGGRPAAAVGKGLPCGFVPNVTYDLHEIQTGPGFRLVMYSDALIEAAGPDGVMLGEDGVIERLADMPAGDPLNADAFLEAILERTVDAASVRANDDLTLVALFAPEAEGGRG